MESLETVVRMRSDDRGRGSNAASRCKCSNSDITMCVVPSPQGVFSLSTTYPAQLI
jgi:hypothetical protein